MIKEKIKMLIAEYFASDHDKVMLEIRKLNEKVDKIYNLLLPAEDFMGDNVKWIEYNTDIKPLLGKLETLLGEGIIKELNKVDDFLSGYIKEKKEKDKKVVEGEVKSSFKRANTKKS